MEGSRTGSALPGNALLAADLQGLESPLREASCSIDCRLNQLLHLGLLRFCDKEPVLGGTKLELGSLDLSSQGLGAFP